MAEIKRIPKYHDIYELERSYQSYTNQDTPDGFYDFGWWLPKLGKVVRPPVPGELVVIIGRTGVGKTAMLQNIAVSARQRSVFLFELELPGDICFERFAAMSNKMEQASVEKAYRSEHRLRLGPLDHIYTCTESGLTVQDMEHAIQAAEQDGNIFDLIIVDYIGLVQSRGARSRYEKVTQAVEDLKAMAKNLNAVVIAASQVHRGTDSGAELSIYDAKDSGSIENSAQIVLGAWRDDDYENLVKIRVLKQTRGPSGAIVETSFDKPRMIMGLRDAEEPEEEVSQAEFP